VLFQVWFLFRFLNFKQSYGQDVNLAIGNSRVEADAVAVVKSAGAAELRNINMGQVEQLVNLSWWNAARTLIIKSHEAHLDFTAPVRRAVNSMKHEADALLRWLDPQFAHPPETSMAMQWAQNMTTVMVAARFAPKWREIGANLAVFSSEHGRGHIDHQRTVQHVQDLLKVNISKHLIQADITAETGNSRRHYVLSVDLFAEAVPEQSTWYVDFRRAQGSMQMSHGAEIPELHFALLKRQAESWPRLFANDLNTTKASIDAWLDAPAADSAQPPLGEYRPSSRGLRGSRRFYAPHFMSSRLTMG